MSRTLAVNLDLLVNGAFKDDDHFPSPTEGEILYRISDHIEELFAEENFPAVRDFYTHCSRHMDKLSSRAILVLNLSASPAEHQLSFSYSRFKRRAEGVLSARKVETRLL